MSRKRQVDQNGLTEKEFLAQYKPKDYERPSVTVDMLIFAVNENTDALKILLIKRKNHPYINCWAVPGGFVGMKESATEAARRELKEETGLENVYLEQLYTFSEPERDPRMRVISVAYMALIPESEVKAGDDAADASWFTIKQEEDRMTLYSEEKNVCMEYRIKEHVLQNGVLDIDASYLEAISEETFAFDHQNLFYTGLVRLRNKAEYTPLLCNLVPKQFTLPQLQKVYELVLNRTMYKTSFMRMIEKYVEKTGEKMEKKGKSSGKPPMYYRYSGK